jgi:hypothetical protein
MVVNSHNQEFGYELLSAVPYAYELHLKGQLEKTISGVGSEPLYYFSPVHEIVKGKRAYYGTLKARRYKLPYTEIHVPERPKLTFPPYKEHYANDEYRWDKPTLVIANRYNMEWSQPPINFFDEKMLDWLFENLKSKYEIIYMAVDLPPELEDEHHSMKLDDRSIAQKHGVKVFNDMAKSKSWNEILLKVFANCEHYITMNGGYSILASLFGGTNIIYTTKKGNYFTKEILHNSFERWYPNHSNQRVKMVLNYNELKSYVESFYIKEEPTVNVIMRTSGRPNAFARAYLSVTNQTYRNINIIVTCDDSDSIAYTRPARARMVEVKHCLKPQRPSGEQYGVFAPYNQYVDLAQRLCKGYIFMLDDDNMFLATNAVEVMVEHSQKDYLNVWKCEFSDRIIPTKTFRDHIELFDIDTACFMYHSDHIEATDWTPWKRADYRTAKKLSEKLNLNYIDCIFVKQQNHAGFGKRVDIMENTDGWMKTVKILHESCGKVGCVKRLPKPIAEDLKKMGYVEYLHNPIGMQPEPVEVKMQDIVIEDKVLKPIIENKDAAKGSKHSNAGRKAGAGSGKKLPKGNE